MAARTPADQIKPGSWDVYEDVDEFVKYVLAELKKIKIQRGVNKKKTPKESLDDKTLERVIMAIWSVCFCGMQWRSVAYMTGIPFGTLFSLFARWTRWGLWNLILGKLIRKWRTECGGAACPKVLIVDSRSCRSSPTCGQRGIDGGKKIKGIKLHVAVDEHGFPQDIGVSTANVHDTVGILPTLCRLAKQGFQGSLLGDSGYKGEKLAAAAEDKGMKMIVAACGDGKQFIPNGIRWVVERSFAWLSRYRRLNTIFDRTTQHLIAFVQIAFISILTRRIARCVTN